MLDDEKPKVSLSEPEVPMDDEELVNIEDLTELDTEELANEESDEINEVDELRAENAELNDRLMRALAEAENNLFSDLKIKESVESAIVEMPRFTVDVN